MEKFYFIGGPCRLVVKSSRCGLYLLYTLREAGSSNPPWDMVFFSLAFQGERGRGEVEFLSNFLTLSLPLT